VRAVLDVNVLVSALLAPHGAPARILLAWIDGAFELVVGPRLLDELGRVLAYRKIRSRIVPEEAHRYLFMIERQALVVSDPLGEPPLRSQDAGDDDLIALAASAEALLVSGDAHLVALIGQAPIQTPAGFLDSLEPRP
jgi:putative PIN family toxin of toxin-antitoxin system